MAERLGLAVIPGTGWSARDIQTIAGEAEHAGFDAIFAAEVNNDVMATAQLMGAVTQRIQVGTVTSRTVELASELADGIMPFLWSAERVRKSRAWIDRGRAKSSGLGKVEVTLGLPTFVGDDLNAMREAARANLGLYTTFPF